MVRKILIGIGVVVAVWFLFIQNGGDTITVLNRSNRDICEIYFAYEPEENGWGPDRIRSEIPTPHSRDIRLPIYFEWFASAKEVGYQGRAVDCSGNEITTIDNIGADTNFIIWEVR